MVLDMAEESHTQIILGRPFLATAGCKIYVKEGSLTFDVGEHHAKFGLFKDFEFSHTFSCCGCAIVDSDEPMDVLDMTLNDPSSFNCTLFKGLGLDDVKVDSFPPIIVETNPYTVDEVYFSTCCRFVTLWMSMPPMSGCIYEMDLEFEVEFELSSKHGARMIVLLDPSL